LPSLPLLGVEILVQRNRKYLYLPPRAARK